MNSLTSFRSTNAGQDRPEGFALSRGFALFSLGLGLTELAAPAAFARLIGLDPKLRTTLTVRALGVREVITGLGILMRPRRAVPMWARVAGDVLDLGLLAWAASGKRTNGQRVAAALVGVAGATALDIYASRRVTRAQEAAAPPVMFSVTINKPPAEVYAFFRQLSNLPLFMDYLDSVEPLTGTRSRWTAKLPVGGTVSWDAELTVDRPGEQIAWQTVEGSKLAHRGKVLFAAAPANPEATEVRVEMEVGLPGIAPSATLAKLLTKPQIKGDLRRMKQVMETGEVLFSDASAHRRPYPAQPSAEGTKFANERAAKSRRATNGGV